MTGGTSPPIELSKLFEATATGPVRHKLAGVSRAMLYRVAMETGLRRNELRSLTLASRIGFGAAGDPRGAGGRQKPEADSSPDSA